MVLVETMIFTRQVQALLDAERMLWQHLRANLLGGWHFCWQQVIGGFIVDFYCHASGVAVELDGAVHATQAGYDTERDQILMAMGLRTLRFTNQEVLEGLDNVLYAILQACQRKT
jgi:very-short-patch-repair endonuclease